MPRISGSLAGAPHPSAGYLRWVRPAPRARGLFERNYNTIENNTIIYIYIYIHICIHAHLYNQYDMIQHDI